MNMGFPDVCNTPVGPATAPIPYPNLAMNAQATPFSPNVKVSQMNALNTGSQIPMTSGDEGGVAHPMIKGPGRFTMGNPVVYVNRMPAINLLCPSTGNNMNNGLGAAVVPSVTNVFFTLGPSDGQAISLSGTDAEMLRAALEQAEVSGRLLAEGVGLLRVGLFSFDAPTRAENEIERLVRLGALALVIDLTGNRGGDMKAALRLADAFLPEGSPLCVVVEADGDERVERARTAAWTSLPLVVLVDRGTASAAELFAGALQVNGRAILLGERTYGKGTAQRVTASEDGAGAAYRTAATLLLPDGRAIDGAGLAPDVELVEPRRVATSVDVEPRRALAAALVSSRRAAAHVEAP